MTRAAICALLLAITPIACSQSADSAPLVPSDVQAKILEEGLEKSQVMDHLHHLTNMIGPRLTSSDRLTQAMEWAKARLESYGLEVRLEKWGEFPVGFNRGPWSGQIVSPKVESLTFTTPAWGAGTVGKQKGEAILAPLTEEALEAMKGNFAGKWVVEYPGVRRRRGRRGGSSGGNPKTISRDLRKELDAVYEEDGILGIVRGSSDELVRTSGNWRISWDKLPKTPKITLVASQWRAIRDYLEGGEPVELEFDVRNYFRKGPIDLFNVVADLKGSEKPDEYVVVGGHCDSWDGATGTTDNGTGASTTIEAARILTAAGAKPQRTIRFMLWGGEEQGLLGSAAFCKAHQAEMSKYSACFVHDGGTNYVSGIGATEHQLSDFERVFAPVLDLHPDRPFEVKKVRGLRGGGSDHGSFLAQGVPGYFWNQSGRSVYGYGWHTQHDTYDIAIPEYQMHTATIVATGALGTANLPNMISREGMRSASERPRQGRILGVQFPDSGEMKVESVVDDSVAAKGGVKPGDILVELDGVKIKDRFALRNAANNGEPKKKLIVDRGGKKVTLELTWPR